MASQEKELLQQQFARAVAHTGGYLPRDAPSVMAEKLELVWPGSSDTALDVACGSGTFALALAPRVSHVYGLDLTWEMLLEAGKARLSQKAPNVTFHRGDAEHLPYKASCFDLVTCGHALHHFPFPERVLGEIAWIIKPSGRIGIFDSVAPEDIEAAILHNRIELLRDPSHRKSLTVSDLLAMFERCRLSVETHLLRVRKRSFHEWMRRAGCEPHEERSRQVRRLMLTDLNADPAGFSPRREGDDIIIHHHEALFLLRPPGGKTAEAKQ